MEPCSEATSEAMELATLLLGLKNFQDRGTGFRVYGLGLRA